MRRIRQLSTATLLFGVFATVAPAIEPASLPSGPSFRLETEIYQNKANEPSARHKILFDSGVMYDLQEQGGNVHTVFDPARGRVILLHTTQQVQTEISTQHLIDITAQLKVAAQQHGKSESFGIDAEVKQTGEEYTVAFGNCRYHTTTQPAPRAELAAAYHELTIWAARLNALRRVGTPPFGRLALGHKLAADGRLPLDMTLSIDRGVSQQHYRAHHLLLEQLSELDRRAIAAVGEQLASFQKVSLEAFPSDD
ncbi:hypothetical protein [Roseimaritima sediminicola]|uniref:hypothetical protein n=1 Tax=Roseimaritima sediminicola TaxID=2662066 RepID=UPI001298468F|nr:hypothetical protein [Roseimaritima sediminicola]